MKSERKQRKQNNEDIIMELPGFINKLMLLLNSGMVLDSAMRKAGEDYCLMEEKKSGYFVSEYIKLCENCEKTGENIIQAFYDFGKFSGCRELSRTAGMLAENMNTGSGLWKQLSVFSEKLWEDRKRICLSRIRLAESKMSFPLGIMLLALIIITAAPAMMQMK